MAVDIGSFALVNWLSLFPKRSQTLEQVELD